VLYEQTLATHIDSEHLIPARFAEAVEIRAWAVHAVARHTEERRKAGCEMTVTGLTTHVEPRSAPVRHEGAGTPQKAPSDLLSGEDALTTKHTGTKQRASSPRGKIAKVLERVLKDPRSHTLSAPTYGLRFAALFSCAFVGRTA
jgi:hypothetical protein